jgi:alanine racemase
MAVARLTIDLDALAANFNVLRGLAGEAEVAPVVKADGYGLGAGPVARRLWAEGARTFYVARLEEGERLRAALGSGRPAAILVLDGVAGPDEPGRLRAAGLAPVLNSLAQIEAWAAASPGLPCAVHVDTGMNRLGLRPEEALALEQGDRLRRLDVRWALSHLALASDGEHALNDAQAAALARVAPLFPGAQVSLANSAGLFLGRTLSFDQVRPGISLYGGGPFGRPDPRLRSVAALDAPVLQVRTVPPGETIGYGATFLAERPIRIAVIAAGYADGVLRSASGRGYAFAEGALRPILGRVSMDLLALDVTEAAAVRPGTRVELFGVNRPIDEAAADAGTLAYELLVRAGARAERVYLGEVA